LGFISSKHAQQKSLQKRKLPENAQPSKMPSDGKFKFIVKKPDTPKSVDFSPFSEFSELPKEVKKEVIETSLNGIDPDIPIINQLPKRVKLITNESQKRSENSNFVAQRSKS